VRILDRVAWSWGEKPWPKGKTEKGLGKGGRENGVVVRSINNRREDTQEEKTHRIIVFFSSSRTWGRCTMNIGNRGVQDRENQGKKWKGDL